MKEEKWVVGPKEKIILHERIYALEAKVRFLTDCLNILWQGPPRVSRGRKGVEVLECTESGKYCYKKPHDLDCGDLGTDCSIVSEKPKTVEEEL